MLLKIWGWSYNEKVASELKLEFASPSLKMQKNILSNKYVYVNFN